MEPRSPSKSKVPIMWFIYNQRALRIGLDLLAVILFLSIGAHVVLGSRFVVKPLYFTVVIDCGSTGTRVNVYEWELKGGVSNQDLPVLIRTYPNNSISSHPVENNCLYHCMQMEPGLDKFVGNASGVRLSIEPLIHWAEQWVPKEMHRETPIFVLATAGLRRLQREDARWIVKNIETVVKNHSFMYRESWVRVLSGKEEAYYGWVALNYKMGVFNKPMNLPTLGLLDLGGSSLQVVAEVDDLIEDKLFMNIKIGSLKHHILAHSWPEFGLNEAFDRTVVMLSHSQALRESPSGTLEVAHPCLGSNFLKNYTCTGCFGLSNTDPENDLSSIFLVGQPNWEHCKLLARAVAVNSSNLDWSSLEDDSECKQGGKMLNSTIITHDVSRFHALSGFFAVYSTLNLDRSANFTKIWEKGKQLCSSSWTNLSSIHVNENYAAQYCFRVPYLASLVEDALCISHREIIFGPGDITWTLGAALVEAQFLWLGASNDQKFQKNILIHKNLGVISYSVLLFMFLVGLLYIVYRYQIKLPMVGKKASVGVASLPLFVLPKRSPS